MVTAARSQVIVPYHPYFELLLLVRARARLRSALPSTKTPALYYRILYSDNVSLQSKLARYNSVDMEFPRGGSAPLGTISYIEVLDKRADGTGGCVYIADGGVGQTRVRLHFKTLWNHGLDFQVNVYGHWPVLSDLQIIVQYSLWNGFVFNIKKYNTLIVFIYPVTSGLTEISLVK